MPYAIRSIHKDKDFTFDNVYPSIEFKDLNALMSKHKSIVHSMCEAVYAMARKGYVNCDLAWRHVALLPTLNEDTWTLKPICLDLELMEQKPFDQIDLSKEIEPLILEKSIYGLSFS